MKSIQLTFNNNRTLTITKDSIIYLFNKVLEDDSIGDLTLNNCINKIWTYLRSWLIVQYDCDMYKGYTSSEGENFSDIINNFVIELYKKELNKHF